MSEPFCKELDWDIKKGKEVADYLMDRTRRTPYFAVASAVMHSGPITYSFQQKFVEKMVEQNPRKFLDPEEAKKAVKGAQFWVSRAEMLPQATKCYIDHCSEKECLKPKGRESLINCLDKLTRLKKGKTKKAGFGRKILDLTREYLGDHNAVAVDRHVMRWACKRAKVVCPKNPKQLDSDVVKPKTYTDVANKIRELAPKCGLTPAELQVAAWMSGACREEAPKGKPLYIGKGKSIYCIHRYVKPLTEYMK